MKHPLTAAEVAKLADALIDQHPEWQDGNGACPAPDLCERCQALLDQITRLERERWRSSRTG